ncbi:unnamed protein product [Urochloa humidicola]
MSEYTMVWECLQKMMMDGCAWSVRGNSTCSCSSHIEVSFGIVFKRPWCVAGQRKEADQAIFVGSDPRRSNDNASKW